MSHNNQQLLINSVKESIFDELRNRHPNFDHYNSLLQAEIISDYSDYDIKTLQQWLEQIKLFTPSQSSFKQGSSKQSFSKQGSSKQNLSQQAFTQLISMANTIRKQL